MNADDATCHLERLLRSVATNAIGITLGWDGRHWWCSMTDQNGIQHCGVDGESPREAAERAFFGSYVKPKDAAK